MKQNNTLIHLNNTLNLNSETLEIREFHPKQSNDFRLK